ncbi:MAG TPA: DUF1003 domain-containing protein [Devosiaceae bacterium]|nr:DUF1003 domain-containing protein [Devosiaceae bacterium]
MSQNPDPDYAGDESGRDEAEIGPEVPVIDSGEISSAEPGTPEEIGRPPSKRIASAISGKRYRKRDLVKVDELRPTLAEFIRRDFPDLSPKAMISVRELARYRMRYTEELLQQEHGEFSELDREVAESIARQDTIAENTEEEFEEHRTFGDKLSDQIASFGGSWAFLISFGVFLFVWMAINVVLGITRAFDPYPFILLNLMLSCIAAVQAPVIMMSQRRQETKDRLRADNDYRVNLKAELEIRHLHEKLDYLISRQWQRLAEIQQIQMDMMHDAPALTKKRRVASTRVRRKPTPPANS